MSKESEFKHDVERITQILLFCDTSYNVLRELYRTKDNSEYQINLKYKNSFFLLTKINYWRVIILQLSKLYGNERFSIVKLLEKSKKGNFYKSIDLNQEMIHKHLQLIDEKEDLLKEVKKQRDKIFAHEDADSINIQNEISLDEAEMLIKLCQDILSEIYSSKYKTHYMFNGHKSALKNLQIILKSLDERNEVRVEDRKDLVKLMQRYDQKE